MVCSKCSCSHKMGSNPSHTATTAATAADAAQTEKVIRASGQPLPSPLIAKMDSVKADASAAATALATTAADYVQHQVAETTHSKKEDAHQAKPSVKEISVPPVSSSRSSSVKKPSCLKSPHRKPRSRSASINAANIYIIGEVEDISDGEAVAVETTDPPAAAVVVPEEESSHTVKQVVQSGLPRGRSPSRRIHRPTDGVPIAIQCGPVVRTLQEPYLAPSNGSPKVVRSGSSRDASTYSLNRTSMFATQGPQQLLNPLLPPPPKAAPQCL